MVPMSVDVDRPVEIQSRLRLESHERAELAALAMMLSETDPGLVDDPEWIRTARQLSCAMPYRLRRVLREFTWDSGADGSLLLSNLPVDVAAVPPTPMVFGSVQRASTVAASALVLIAMAAGELIAFDKEKQGALVQDVVPVPGMAEYQGNAGSVRLNMHTENAFHAHRPDFVALMCLRQDHDNVAGLITSCIRNALPLLSDRVVTVLREPRFVTEPPASFDLPPGAVAPQAILTGERRDPDMCLDFTSTTPLDDEAAEAMATLRTAIDRVSRTFLLQPGELALVDNRVALHGRTEFRPRHDHADRWLQRAFIHVDFRRSRALRRGGGHVISSEDA
jgi:TfdA family taurine catabolism dioxygenase TauD